MLWEGPSARHLSDGEKLFDQGVRTSGTSAGHSHIFMLILLPEWDRSNLRRHCGVAEAFLLGGVFGTSNFQRILGKSKRGLTNGGLSPKFSEKIGQKSFRENRTFSGLIGAISGPIGAFLGLIGTAAGRQQKFPERAFLGPIAAFWARPPFAKPPFGLPQE